MSASTQSHPHVPRTSERFTVDLAVEFKLQNGRTMEGRMKNVSQGGMYLETPKILKSGQKSFFKLQLRPNSLQFHLEGEVVWSQKNQMGIRFLLYPRQNQNMLESLISALKQYIAPSSLSH